MRCMRCLNTVQIQYVDDKAVKIVERYDVDENGKQEYVVHDCYVEFYHSYKNGNGNKIKN